MAFFQSNFAIRQRSKYNSAALGPEVASDIVFRTAHTGNRLVTFTVSEGNDSARVHSSAGAALVARVSHRRSGAALRGLRALNRTSCTHYVRTLFHGVYCWIALLDLFIWAQETIQAIRRSVSASTQGARLAFGFCPEGAIGLSPGFNPGISPHHGKPSKGASKSCSCSKVGLGWRSVEVLRQVRIAPADAGWGC